MSTITKSFEGIYTKHRICAQNAKQMCYNAQVGVYVVYLAMLHAFHKQLCVCARGCTWCRMTSYGAGGYFLIL